ncbi:MAG TPA: uroporphyrinogen decarboxylase family protein [Planctomycetota bacterium]|jgi:uroporphyrinogen decarboxylase
MKRETMTSRERVIRTLKREPVDRAPIDLGSHTSTGISAFAYWNLRKHLGLPVNDIWVHDVVQVLGNVDEDIRQRFHIDCIYLEPRWEKTVRWSPRAGYEFSIPATMKPEKNAEGEWIVRQGEQSMRMPAGGYFFDGAWLANWGGCSEDEAIEVYGREAERIYKETPYATNFLGYTRGGGFGAFFGGLDRLVKMLEEPDAVKQEHRAWCDDYMRRAGKVIDRMGKFVQLITICDDMGMQQGPMCSVAMVEQFVAPYIKEFCSFVHRNSDIKVFMHNCGSIAPLIPTLIDCGVDVLNPVQISAKNMDAADLKAKFGAKIVFWGGGCDTQNVLGSGTPQAVAENVRKLVRAFKPGGGYVFNQVHNILGNVPPENIVAMLDAAYEESWQ